MTKIIRSPVDRAKVRDRVSLRLVSNSVFFRIHFCATCTLTTICWFHMLHLTLVVLNSKKTVIFVMNFIKSCSKSQFLKMRMKI